MKFKVGDKVKIKPIEWWEQFKDGSNYLYSVGTLYKTVFNGDFIEDYSGTHQYVDKVTVEKYGACIHIAIDGDKDNMVYFLPDMLEIVELAKEEKTLEKSKTDVSQKEYSATADQSKKFDADKLRYDLIPGELLTGLQVQDMLAVTVPGVLTVEYLDKILSCCISILGGWNNFLRELAKVYTFGCKKYSEKSWQTVPNGRERYEAGMFRHIDAFMKGEYVNWEDGGCLHIAQAAFNAIAVKWFMQNNIGDSNE